MRAFYAVAALGATLALCGPSASLAGPGGEPEKTVPQGQDPPFGRLFDRGGKLRIDESERANAAHAPYLGGKPPSSQLSSAYLSKSAKTQSRSNARYVRLRLHQRSSRGIKPIVKQSIHLAAAIGLCNDLDGQQESLARFDFFAEAVRDFTIERAAAKKPSVDKSLV